MLKPLKSSHHHSLLPEGEAPFHAHLPGSIALSRGPLDFRLRMTVLTLLTDLRRYSSYEKQEEPGKE